MIDKIYDSYEMICDVCGDIGEPCDTWNDVRHSIKRQGWRTTKVDGDWMDLCPTCYAELKAEQK